MKSHPLQPLIESVLEAVWLVDAIGLTIVAVNHASERMLGIAREQMLGRPVVDFAHTSEDLFFWEDVASGLSDTISSETIMTGADGGLVHVDRRVSRMQDGGGAALYVVAMVDRSAQHRVEQELENIIAELRATLESTADGILVVDMDGGIRGYNRRFAELWELPDALMTERDDGAIFCWLAEHVADESLYLERMAKIARSPLLEAEDVLMLRSGRVLERTTLPQYARGRPIGRVYSFRDITQRLADETRLKLASHVFESSLDAIFVVDTGFRMLAANPSFFRLTGHDDAGFQGRAVTEFVADAGEPQQLAQIAAAAVEHGFWQGELWARRASGETYPCLLSMLRVQDADGAATHYIGFFKDLTESLAAKQRIEELAFSDALTRLPNRVLLRERFEFAISHAQRNRLHFAVLFLDLDRFKQINDSLGHAFGDRVLVEVAGRLQLCLRQVDTAARLGGDEFVLLLNQVDGVGAETVARRVLDSVLKPITLDGMSFSLTCSIGIAMYPDDGADMDELIKNADSAMYAVKSRGRSDFRFYQRQMNIGLLSRVKLDHALRQALECGAFKLHYQPKVDLGSGELVGVEALARWRDPELGDVPPAKFIPVAEESGAIVPLGNWVMEEAIRQAAQWRAEGFEVPIAINVSAAQFHQSSFVDGVAEALQRHGLPGHLLELELTESILISDIDEVMRRLNALFAHGVKLAIDDFGTGFSSLSYLKRFPIGRLKIDRSFIADVPGDLEDEAIVGAVIQLGKALHLAVTAEGVETEAQRQFLLEQDCREAQGFFYAPALPAEQLRVRFGPGAPVAAQIAG